MHPVRASVSEHMRHKGPCTRDTMHQWGHAPIEAVGVRGGNAEKGEAHVPVVTGSAQQAAVPNSTARP